MLKVFANVCLWNVVLKSSLLLNKSPLVGVFDEGDNFILLERVLVLCGKVEEQRGSVFVRWEWWKGRRRRIGKDCVFAVRLMCRSGMRKRRRGEWRDDRDRDIL